MGFLEGLFKIAGGVVSSGMGGACSDGPAQFCPKCGSIHHGICTNCATKRGAELIDEGIKDIKSSDEQIYIDAEKRGYARASKEYGVVFSEIQSEYNQAKQRFEQIIREDNIYSEQLITQHEQLLATRKSLEAEAERKVKMVAEKSGVSTGAVKRAISGNVFSYTGSVDLFAMLHNYKEKKIREAECKGYNRAKTEYEKKICTLKREFEELQSMCNHKIQELHDLIANVLTAIGDERMKIATMKIME